MCSSPVSSGKMDILMQSSSPTRKGCGWLPQSIQLTKVKLAFLRNSIFLEAEFRPSFA